MNDELLNSIDSVKIGISNSSIENAGIGLFALKAIKEK
jgi:hypothetical protein